MNERQQPASQSEPNVRRRALACLLFPLSLFPLAALLSYDWRSVPDFNTPALPSANWIGALGDAFARWGEGTGDLAPVKKEAPPAPVDREAEEPTADPWTLERCCGLSALSLSRACEAAGARRDGRGRRRRCFLQSHAQLPC